MLASSTDFLAYVVVMFLLWIYVPYILFRLFAERNVDLGRSRDETWFEEMIGAFLPSALLHALPAGIYAWLCYKYPEHFSVDLAVMASMFGENRGAVSDYIYSGNWRYCFVYIGLLWVNAGIAGCWFGWSASRLCKLNVALEGIEYIRNTHVWRTKVMDALWHVREDHPFPRLAKLWRHLRSYIVRIGWFCWSRFFHESIVPLYTWREHSVYVRIETTTGELYCGTFVGYEKTTGGAIDAVRLMNAVKLDESPSAFEMRALYINWCEIRQMNVVTGLKETVEALKRSSEKSLKPEKSSSTEEPPASGNPPACKKPPEPKLVRIPISGLPAEAFSASVGLAVLSNTKTSEPSA